MARETVQVARTLQPRRPMNRVGGRRLQADVGLPVIYSSVACVSCLSCGITFLASS
jgi:hypothetical protein